MDKEGMMKSYLTIIKDPEAKTLELNALLQEGETIELAHIRHYIVQHITAILSPNTNRVTFKWANEEE